MEMLETPLDPPLVMELLSVQTQFIPSGTDQQLESLKLSPSLDPRPSTVRRAWYVMT